MKSEVLILYFLKKKSIESKQIYSLLQNPTCSCEKLVFHIVYIVLVFRNFTVFFLYILQQKSVYLFVIWISNSLDDAWVYQVKNQNHCLFYISFFNEAIARALKHIQVLCGKQNSLSLLY